jgi:hypothetical protein
MKTSQGWSEGDSEVPRSARCWISMQKRNIMKRVRVQDRLEID